MTTSKGRAKATCQANEKEMKNNLVCIWQQCSTDKKTHDGRNHRRNRRQQCAEGRVHRDDDVQRSDLGEHMTNVRCAFLLLHKKQERGFRTCPLWLSPRRAVLQRKGRPEASPFGGGRPQCCCCWCCRCCNQPLRAAKQGFLFESQVALTPSWVP